MAEVAKDQDQSMEDILQSIKRIIAEEGDPVPPPPAAEEDILDLTEMVTDEVAAEPAAEEPAPAAPEMSIDEIMAAPRASMAAEPVAPKMESAPMPSMPVPEPIPMEGDDEPAMPAAKHTPDDGLMSEVTRMASMAALSALNEAKPPSALAIPAPAHIGFRSGSTVEDLVLESLRPMLREWIDSHLPSIVERLVDREIRKISRS